MRSTTRTGVKPPFRSRARADISAPLTVSIPDGASALGIGETKMRELLDAGEVESFKIGRRRVVVAESLHSYVERQRRAQRQLVR